MKQLEVKRKQVEYLAGIGEIIILLFLTRKIGLEGIGIFLIPIAIYYFFWVMIVSTYPDALGKMIRVKKSKGQYRNVRRIKTMALIIQAVAGGIGTFCMFLFGTVLVKKGFCSEYCVFLVQLLSPIVFFRSITATFVGLTQGEGSELPAVITSVLRVGLIFGFGNLIGNFFQNYGEKVSMLLKQEHYTGIYIGAGWCLAMVCSEVVLAFVSFLCYVGTKKKKNIQEGEGMKVTDGVGSYLSLCFQNMRYKVLIQILEYLPAFLGMLLYFRKTSAMREVGYGSYFVGYFSLCIMLTFLLNIVIVPFGSKIGGFIRHDDIRQARVCFYGGIHLIFTLGLIICCTIAVMPMQVGALLGFTSPKLQAILLPGCFWVLAMALAFYFSRLLVRLGKSLLVVGVSVIHIILYLLLFSILFKNQDMGLMALMYAGVIAGGIYSILLGVFTKQMMGGKLAIAQIIVIPIIFALIVTLVEVLLVKFLYGFLGNLLTVLVIGGGGMLAFWCGLLLMRSFYPEELRVIPGGKPLLLLGEIMEIF